MIEEADNIPGNTISNGNNSPIVTAHKESIFPTFISLHIYCEKLG
jgi:hypothetical protein